MKVLVAYYSMYGHVMQLARAVEAGAKSVAGADVILRWAKEFPEVEQATANQPRKTSRSPACSACEWRTPQRNSEAKI